ncbi:ParB N-terminal domain-containing protein [Rhizobium lusitanum]|uniref:Chromosome partitioning protein, ParB family n=1 Tax=Rhizobium lusitanum TaxID=293958 RepID=A0A1C3US00_9HYPH|nr:ParB N-terminal domain-containing protein [Rhizobium lusitanum]SCB18266.1 chromosome partitioning protein, ParB family [Rhizobium lusitanum]
MAELKLIPIDQIVVPERLRTVEEEHARAIAQSIVEHGLINPITVRATPAAKGGNWTLVAGAHRLRAFEINGEPEIDAMLVEGDKAEAQLIEITENLFRNDLSVMDRAIFVQSYRDVWESKYGKVEPGRPGNRANLSQLLADEAEAGSFSVHVADRLGVSRRAVERLNRIAQDLHPTLRSQLRGTPAADNQSMLLKLAKEGPKRQQQIAAALKKEPDLSKVLEAAKEPAKEVSEADKQRAVRVDLDRAWKSADRITRVLFVFDMLVEAGVANELRNQVKAAMEKAQ